MIRGTRRQNLRRRTLKATDETAIEPQGQQARRTMRGLALTSIPKSGQKRRADHIAVAQDRRPRRQDGGDPAQLQTVQHLPMRQMDIGDAEAVKFQKLADAPDDEPPLQGQILRRPMKRMRTPGSQPVMAPRQGAARIMSAEFLRHAVDGILSPPASAAGPADAHQSAPEYARCPRPANAVNSSL